MKQLGFTVMLYVVVLSPLAAVCNTSAQNHQVRIPKGTPVRLRLAEGLSTSTVHKGDAVHLELASDLGEGAMIVAPAGTQATATVTCSRPGRGKKPGAIDFSDPELILDGEKIRLVCITRTS